MRSVWSGARDEMLDFLARRDLKEQQETDRANARADRERSFGLQERQIRNSEEQTTVSNRRLDDAEKERRSKEARIQGLIKTVIDKNVDPAVREQAGMELDALGVAPSAVKSVLHPESTTEDVYQPGRDGRLTKVGTVPKNARVIGREPAPPTVPAAQRDDPSLPRGVKDWINSIQARGVPIEQARAELSQGWAQQRAAHPNVDLAEAARYLAALYPLNDDPLAARQRSSLGDPGVAAAARSGSTPSPPELAAAGDPAAGGVPPQVQTLLQNVPDGKRVTLTDGSVWEKVNGQVRRTK